MHKCTNVTDQVFKLLPYAKENQSIYIGIVYVMGFEILQDSPDH